MIYSGSQAPTWEPADCEALLRAKLELCEHLRSQTRVWEREDKINFYVR